MPPMYLDAEKAGDAGVNVHHGDGPRDAWALWRLRATGGAHAIESVHSAGQYLRVTDNGTDHGGIVQLGDDSSVPESLWRVQRVSDAYFIDGRSLRHADDVYTIESIHLPGKYLRAGGSG